MKINAVLPYFGAKRTQADGVVDALGGHTAYHEPFCGSLAVLLAKPPCRQEVVNDLNGRLVNLLRVVQDDALAPRLFDRLRRTAFAADLHAAACGRLAADPGATGLDAAYDYFVCSWQGRNGLAGTDRELASGFCKRFTSTGGDPATRFRHAVESVPAWWERLRGVTVLCEDGVALLGRIEDRAGTAVYCDPPYLEKGGRYAVDFAGGDHERLAASLRRFGNTRVVVSYYDHPALDDLYLAHGFVKVPVDARRHLGVGPAPEVLLVR